MADRIAFGSFTLDPAARLLMEDGVEIRLGSRALELLMVLIEADGELVDRQTIIDRVWPTTVVVDANLSVHVAALRRTLGDGQDGRRFIVTNPGRGYCFVAPVERTTSNELPTGLVGGSAPAHNIPAQLTRLVGREGAVAAVQGLLGASRLTAVVGPAGVGKTSLALKIAEDCISVFPDGAWFVDLTSVSDARLVASSIASALQADNKATDARDALDLHLAGRTLLLVVDNCEHLTDAVAGLLHPLLLRHRGLKVLATSREPLRVHGEAVYRLPPLESPATSVSTASEALRFPAVRLLVERARALVHDFEFPDRDAPYAAEICRGLDGLPLAIEFAVARVDTFGLRGLAHRLNDHAPTAGSRAARNRAAPHRQESMRAALDWSYDLLSSDEQKVFRRVGVFAGPASLEATVAVAGGGVQGAPEIISELVAKSLIATVASAGEIRFRLLETTRDFAREKLVAAGEDTLAAEGHALHWVQALGGAEDSPERFAALAEDIDNIRAALAWSSRSPSRHDLFMTLTAASATLWLKRSLYAECRFWMEQALQRIPPDELSSPSGAAILSALTVAELDGAGIASSTIERWKTLKLEAERKSNAQHRFDALLALWTASIREPDYDVALDYAREHTQIAAAAGAPFYTCMSEWMLATTLFSRGAIDPALAHAAAFLELETEQFRWAYLQRIGFDRRSDMLAMRGQSFCLKGELALGYTELDRSVREAEATGYDLPVTQALHRVGYAHHLVRSDVAVVEDIADRLIELSKPHGFSMRYAFGLALKAACFARKGDLDAAESGLRAALAGLSEAGYNIFKPFAYCELGRVQIARGALDDAERSLGQLETISPRTTHWLSLEALAAQTELALARRQHDRALSLMTRSLALSRAQGAVLWQVRTQEAIETLQRR
jgi:predicted ATPase/DNA-binding winged helix-turn-helix (wHTH) protein